MSFSCTDKDRPASGESDRRVEAYSTAAVLVAHTLTPTHDEGVYPASMYTSGHSSIRELEMTNHV